MRQHQSETRARVDSVAILLATYNGSKYLRAQLDSLVDQTWDNWTIYVGDDGSSDATVELLEQFQSEHPGRLTVLSGERAGGPRANFFRLLHNCPDRHEFVALCDQDDVWHPEKLERLVDRSRVGSGHEPRLVYSDLSVVDESLRPSAPSFLGQIRSRPSRISFGNQLVENAIPGCSMLLNRALMSKIRAYAGPVDSVLMHDWWIALIATAFGETAFVDAPLVQYRQHGSNAAGSVKRSGFGFMWAKVRARRHDGAQMATIRQAHQFRVAYGDSLPPGAVRSQLDAFCALPERSKVERVMTCIRYGLLKQTMSRRIFQLLGV